VDLVHVEAAQVEERRAERTRRENRELLRSHALAEEHLLDERHARRLRLRLQLLRLVLGHQPALGERAGEDR
jgi:hypothetical protein